MAHINHKTREIYCKVAYYGPQASGKTASLKYLYAAVPHQQKSLFRSYAKETIRYIFFEFLAPPIIQVHGYTLRYYIVAVPGASLYERERRAIVKNADGIIFVADSNAIKLGENLHALREIAYELRHTQRPLHRLPFVLQYNKRDIPAPYIIPTETLQHYLNILQWPAVCSVAWHYPTDNNATSWRTGHGVLEAFYTLQNSILLSLQSLF